MSLRLLAACAAVTSSCAGGPAAPSARAPAPQPVTISVVGTNDLHGHLAADGDIGGLAVFGGYLANLRAARAADGGGVLLLDAGDAFQGTLESNMTEGEVVVAVYNLFGYHAMAVGNHEFDYGPSGPEVSAKEPSDDPRGALKARAAQAHYPFLTANVEDEATGRPIAAPNLQPSTMVEVAGVKIGIVGASTADTPTSTLAANFKGLALRPLAPAIAAAAKELRARGATIVALVAHAGLCRRTDESDLVRRCGDGEIADVVRELPPGTVDVVIAGHTHIGASLDLGGVPIVEGWKYGRGFDRVDIVVAAGRIVSKKMYEPTLICGKVSPGTERCDKDAPAGTWVQATYEGRPVTADAAAAKLLQPYLERARAQREDKLGVRVVDMLSRSYAEESPFGNLVADLMHAARPHADAAVTNGGGLRTDLPVGELTYGQLFEAYPFDNRFAEIKISARSLRSAIAQNLSRSKGILSLSGLRAKAVCTRGALDVVLTRDDGRPLADDQRLTIATSDFLAQGGMEGTMGGMPDVSTRIEEGTLLREEIIAVLRKRGGTLSGKDKKLFDPAQRRLDYPGVRPVSCP